MCFDRETQLQSLSSFGRLALGRHLSVIQSLEEAEESGGFTDPTELDAEGLHLDEQILDINDLVPDEGLEEDAHQTHQTVLQETQETSAVHHTIITLLHLL